eukprot:scaffold502012_cov52-Prasinocladus_malaysianus.AAC.1
MIECCCGSNCKLSRQKVRIVDGAIRKKMHRFTLCNNDIFAINVFKRANLSAAVRYSRAANVASALPEARNLCSARAARSDESVKLTWQDWKLKEQNSRKH